MGRTKTNNKKEDDGGKKGYSKPSSGDYLKKEETAEPNLSDALLELDPTREQFAEPVSETPADIKAETKKTQEFFKARVELIKSIALAHDRLKEIDGIKGLRTEAQKSKIEKVFKELDKISVGLEETENLSLKEMADRIAQYKKRIESFNNKISDLKKEIKEMADKLIEEGKEPVAVKETKNSPEKIKSPIMSEKEIAKMVDYLDDVAKDGHIDSDYQKWSDILRAQLPEKENESEQIKSKRKLFDKAMFEDNNKKIHEHLKLIHGQKQADTMIGLKSGEEKAKWEKRKVMLDDIFGNGLPTEIIEDEEKSTEQIPVEEISTEPVIEIPGVGENPSFETFLPTSETIMPIPETIENPEEDIFESAFGDVVALREYDEKIQRLSAELAEARNKLKESFIKKEKTSGIVGKFKKMFSSKESEQANQEYDVAWNEYAKLQKEMIEANKAQAESLRDFLKQESNDLQAKIAEYYKGKENIISKVWKRLGEMNLANYLEKKSVAVKAMEEQGEEIGKWDRFWVNRAKELEQSNKLYKIGAKVLSVRLGLSMGLLGGGIFGIPGVAEARGAFVGLGSAMGSRHLEDAAQNKIQRWLGNRGEFYSSSTEAQKIMEDKFGIVEKTFDEGAPTDEPEDKKTIRRRKKFERMLGKAHKDLLEFESLPVEKKLEKIQEKISAIEAYAYVNGMDLSKDATYQQLLMAREISMEKFLAEKAVEIGDERPVLRPDALEDAMAFLDSRKKELAKTAEKVAGEKRLRWAKRLVSVTVGAISGTYAYLATLSRAELFNGGGSETAEVTPTSITPAVEVDSSAPASGIGEFEVGENINMEDYIVPMNSEDLAMVKNFVTSAEGNEKAMEAFNKAINEGHSPKEIYESFLVHKGDGLERILQRQLIADSGKFGFQGDLEDANAINKWAGHEASVIAQKQGIDDRYFIFNEKQPKFLILNEDKTVEVVGKLHHVSEIAKAKIREAVRLAQESTEQTAPVPSEEGVYEVRQVIDAMTGEPKILTNIEQMEFDKLFGGSKYEEAMDYMLEHRARGPIFETADGSQVHRADIGEWEGEVPKIKVPSGVEVTYDYLGSDRMYVAYSPSHELKLQTIGTVESGEQLMAPAYNLETEYAETKDFVDALKQAHPDSPEYRAIINTLKDNFSHLEQLGKNPSEAFGQDVVAKVNASGGYIKEAVPPAEIEIAQTNPEAGVDAEIFETKPINSFDSRFGTVEFEYDDQGQPAQFKVPDNTTPRDFQTSFDRVFVPSGGPNADISMGTSGLVRAIDVYDNIYVDMQNQGLQNTAEAGLIKDTIKRFSRLASKDIGKEPGELFNEEIVNRYNLKNK